MWQRKRERARTKSKEKSICHPISFLIINTSTFAICWPIKSQIIIGKKLKIQITVSPWSVILKYATFMSQGMHISVYSAWYDHFPAICHWHCWGAAAVSLTAKIVNRLMQPAIFSLIHLLFNNEVWWHSIWWF